MTDTTLPVGGNSFQVGRTLGTSIAVLFRNLPSFVLAAVLLSIPMFVLGLLLGAAEDEVTIYVMAFLLVVVGLLTYLLIIAALTYGTVQDLSGRKASSGAIVSHALKALLPAIGVAIFLALIVSIGLMALIIPGLILSCVLYVALPVVVVERTGIFQSLGRSAELTKGNRWKILALVIIAYFISAIVEVASETINAVAGQTGSAEIIAGLIGLVLFVLSTTWSAVLVAVAYNDLRVAKEGISTEQIAAVFD